MKNFDANWQACAARAREAEPHAAEAPLGFATRVAARAMQTPPSLEAAWQQLTWRFLAGVAAALMVCTAVEMPHLRDHKPLEPGIENAVAQVVWSL